MVAASDVLSYFRSRLDLDAYLYLNGLQNMGLHWADWQKGCLFKGEYSLATLGELVAPLKQRSVYTYTLEDHKRDPRSISLYQYYLLMASPALRKKHFLSHLKVSKTGREGEYWPIHRRPDWFNNQEYRDVMGHALMVGKMSYRSLRLHMDRPVSTVFLQNDGPVKVELRAKQLSRDGILFEMDAQVFKAMVRSRRVALYLDLNLLKSSNADDLSGVLAALGRAGVRPLSTDEHEKIIYLNPVNWRVGPNMERDSWGDVQTAGRLMAFVRFRDLYKDKNYELPCLDEESAATDLLKTIQKGINDLLIHGAAA